MTGVWLHAELLMNNTKLYHSLALSLQFHLDCYGTDLYVPRASVIMVETVLKRHEPHATEGRNLRYRRTLMHMHKEWNDGCTVSLRVLEWFMWLCDLNINFCECLTAQVFREQMENKSITWPRIYTCMGHEWD